ncbi:hypothetical protein [Pararobbsia alpina]|uniref:hypothetical protein n=1 Tax=Pararobbsia alpina TaxID=621374 RepID=UPI0039A66EB7
MSILVFKLLFTPLLLLAATVATRRWGEAVGGCLIGLPLTSGPISMFLALDHGPAFAAQAAAGSLAATIAQACFALAYCALAMRGWQVAAAGAFGAFAVAGWILQKAALPPAALFLLAVLAMTVALVRMPKATNRVAMPASPWWDLPLRMTFITALVLGVTMFARHVGASVSGLLSSFPFIVSFVGICAHRAVGAEAAQQVMRGLVSGLLGFASFFFVLTLLLGQWPLPFTYGAAVLCALAVQGVSLYRMRVPVLLQPE